MTTHDYHVTMTRKPLRVAEFKARLSAYLRRVRAGQELTIYDRDQPIARVVPYDASGTRLIVREPLHRYSSLGAIELPPPADLAVDAAALLVEERDRDR
jgi:prevent-host-death family protein